MYLSPGPRAAGTLLRYAHTEAGCAAGRT